MTDLVNEGASLAVSAPDPAPAPAIYNYDHQSGLFMSVGEADPSPLEADKWLLPANATLSKPPIAPEGQVAVMSETNGWLLLPDNRGDWFNAQAQAVEITDVQADVTGLTRTPPPTPDHVLTNGQWQLDPIKVQARFKAAKDALLAQARAQREVVLNRLIGISFAAKEAGNAPIFAACMTARQDLLDLTKHASIAGATTEAGLKAAYKTLYGGIVSRTPTDIQSVYKDIQV